MLRNYTLMKNIWKDMSKLMWEHFVSCYKITMLIQHSIQILCRLYNICV